MDPFNELLERIPYARCENSDTARLMRLVRECAAERDALKAELSAVRLCFAEASHSAGPTTVHVDALKAANSELCQVIEWLRENSPVDFLGTGSDSRAARREETEWNKVIEQALAKHRAPESPTIPNP